MCPCLCLFSYSLFITLFTKLVWNSCSPLYYTLLLPQPDFVPWPSHLEWNVATTWNGECACHNQSLYGVLYQPSPMNSGVAWVGIFSLPFSPEPVNSVLGVAVRWSVWSVIHWLAAQPTRPGSPSPTLQSWCTGICTDFAISRSGRASQKASHFCCKQFPVQQPATKPLSCANKTNTNKLDMGLLSPSV